MATKNQPKKPDAAPAAGSSVPTKAPALEIVCERGSFRRAGMVFGKQPAIIKRSHLTKTQIEQLKAEPLLTVTEVEIDEEAADTTE